MTRTRASWQTIVEAVLDPAFHDVSPALTLTLLFLLDRDETRRFLRPQQVKQCF